MNAYWPEPPNGAVISEDRMYRYALWRTWGGLEKYVAFIGLNPSKADETTNDHTISVCMRYARRWGMNGMAMLNLFGLRSTDPTALYDNQNPIGDDNDKQLLEWAARAEFVVVCWGNHAAAGTRFHRRAQYVVEMLRKPPSISMFHLGLTALDAPRHPARLRSDVVPVRYFG